MQHEHVVVMRACDCNLAVVCAASKCVSVISIPETGNSRYWTSGGMPFLLYLLGYFDDTLVCSSSLAGFDSAFNFDRFLQCRESKAPVWPLVCFDFSDALNRSEAGLLVSWFVRSTGPIRVSLSSYRCSLGIALR